MGIEPMVKLRQHIETHEDISQSESKTVQNKSPDFLAPRKWCHIRSVASPRYDRSTNPRTKFGKLSGMRGLPVTQEVASSSPVAPPTS